MILDIHTHHAAPQPSGVVNIAFMANPDFAPLDGQLYSAGIHPWDTVRSIDEKDWLRLATLLERPDFAAVGEAGVDLSGRAGMMYVQLQTFRRQIDLSEKLHKPLIVHCVKAEDVICGLIRDLKPTQPWIIHGFRKKPEVASQLLRAGCFISLGQHFNIDTLKAIPDDRMLAETDESPMTIRQVITAMNHVAERDLTPLIAANTAAVLNLPDISA